MKKEKGFTLIELLLVIAIILMLGASSAVFYSRFINQNSVSNISDDITEEMHKAQIYAMMGKNNSNWGVKLVGSTLTLFSSASSAFDENFSIASAISISGLTTVNFTKITGLPDATPTITISGGGNSKTLTVNSQGVINR
jgi:prepilin-type N-terminal cleavage/methylation domain-containing protein